MSSPYIWIIFPLITSLLLYIFRRRDTIIWIIAISITIFLTWLAWQIPLGSTITLKLRIANPTLIIHDSISVLGRLFILSDQSRPALLIIYLTMSVWFGAVRFFRKNHTDIPFGLMTAAFLSAALAIKPEIHSVLIIGFAIFSLILIIVPPRTSVSTGVLRFLVLQIIGLFLVLFAKWSFSFAAATDQNAIQIPALVGLFLGLAMVLAIFPFQYWSPTLANQVHPISYALVLFLIPTMIIFLQINFINSYLLMGYSEKLFIYLRIVATFMIVSGGISAFLESNLSRMMAYAAPVQVGSILLTLNFLEPKWQPFRDIGIYYAQIIVWGMNMALWAFSLALIQKKRNDLQLQSVTGLLFEAPFISSALLIAVFSASGAPLLANFPILMLSWSLLTKENFMIIMMSWLGTSFLFFAGIRILRHLTTTKDQEVRWYSSESTITKVYIAVGILILFALGIFPNYLLPYLIHLGGQFCGFG